MYQGTCVGIDPGSVLETVLPMVTVVAKSSLLEYCRLEL